MATGKLELLREHQLAPAFRKALKAAGEGVVAVPFCGKGAAKLLGLDSAENVRVICNLDQPGCNPYVIEALRDLKIKVKTHPRLHAKIYATEALAIVGSSNASSNGLTVEGKEAQGWVELNVASSKTGFIDSVRAEFEALWSSKECRTVRPIDLKRAKKRRDRMPPTLLVLPDDQPLFEAARRAPGAFRHVYLAIYGQGLSKEGKRTLNGFQENAIELEPGRAGFDAGSLKNAWGYQFERMPVPAWLIDVSNKVVSRFVGTARSLDFALAVPPGKDNEPQYDLTPALRGPIEIGGRAYHLTKAEKDLLVRHADALNKKAGDSPLPIAKVLEILDRTG